MFRDLKEYQEIYNLYQNSVYLTEEQREFVEAINEAELTDEELYYFSENFLRLFLLSGLVQNRTSQAYLRNFFPNAEIVGLKVFCPIYLDGSGTFLK